MSIDVPLFIAYVYILVVDNVYGWGIFHDKRFIVFFISSALLYLFVSLSNLLTRSTVLRLKISIILFFIAVSVFLATSNLIYLRQITSVTGFINDSALQTEIAGRMLLLGKNPYSESYVNTDLAKWPYTDDAGNTNNPALYYNVIPPLMTIISALGFRLFSQILGWFDIRVFIITAYLLIVILSFLKFKFKENLLLFLILVGLNPLFLINMIHGSNDIVVLACLLWSLFFLEKKRLTISSIILGIGVAAKQTVWLAIPFYLYYAYKKFKKQEFVRFLTITIFVVLIFYLPFLLWNPDALGKSLVFFVSGSSTVSYPISGFGFGSLLLFLKIIPSIYAYYPFWIWQLTFGLILLILFFRQGRKLTGSVLLSFYGCLLTAVWFFNRYFNSSHLSFIMVLIASAYVWKMDSLNSYEKK